MSAYTDRMNALNRMTPEQRDAEILRQAFGPLFAQMFGGVVAIELHAERLRRSRDASEARHQSTPPEAA